MFRMLHRSGNFVIVSCLFNFLFVSGRFVRQNTLEAINTVNSGLSIRKTAKQFNIPYSSLNRYVKKYNSDERNIFSHHS